MMLCDCIRCHRSLLVTVLKVGTIAVFKDSLVNLIGRSLSHDLIQIAEVKDNCIVRLLVSRDIH